MSSVVAVMMLWFYLVSFIAKVVLGWILF